MLHAHKSACLATFPDRRDLLEANLPRLLAIFSSLRICLNEYTHVPEFLKGDARIKAFLPQRDHKDVGKFVNAGDEPANFFLDDDIVYPPDYADMMIALAQQLANPVVLGVHGVIYRRGYKGGSSGRHLLRFYSGLSKFVDVDVLGTGTIMISGISPPRLEFMEGSAGFVDVRFGRYCAELGIPRICIPRPSCWLTACQHDGARLFDEVTSKASLAVRCEVEKIVQMREADRSPRQLPRVPLLNRVRIGASYPAGLLYRSRRSARKMLP